MKALEVEKGALNADDLAFCGQSNPLKNVAAPLIPGIPLSRRLQKLVVLLLVRRNVTAEI